MGGLRGDADRGGGGVHGCLGSPGGSGAVASGGELRVAALNTWGMRADWPVRRLVFQAGCRELDADIITLQETILHDTPTRPRRCSTRVNT